MRLILSCVLFLCAGTVQAQETVVAKAKADLQAAGVAVEHGACTDFAIAKIVAGRIANGGLLLKDCCGDNADPNRTHCELNGAWFAHDVVIQDGHIFDIAVDGGGSNGPSWQDAGVADPSKVKSAASLGLTGVVPGGSVPPPPPPPPPNTDIEKLNAAIAAIHLQIVQLQQSVAAAQLTADHVGQGLDTEIADRTNKDTDTDTQIKTIQGLIPTGCVTSIFGVAGRCNLKVGH